MGWAFKKVNPFPKPLFGANFKQRLVCQQAINAKIQQNPATDHQSDIGPDSGPDVDGTDLTGGGGDGRNDPDASAQDPQQQQNVSSWKYHQSFQVL